MTYGGFGKARYTRRHAALLAATVADVRAMLRVQRDAIDGPSFEPGVSWFCRAVLADADVEWCG